MSIEKSSGDRPFCGLTSAFRAEHRFLVRIGLFPGQRKQHLAGATGTNFKIGHTPFIDFSGEQEFDRIIADDSSVAELDEGDSIVESFKNGFLSPPIEQVSEHKNRLAFSFDAEVFERVLRRRRAGIPT